MTRAILACALAALNLGLAAPALGKQAADPRVEVLNQFRERLDAYLELRKEASSGVKKLEETKSPEEITARQRALRRAITTARSHARQGDIFFPEAAALVKETVRDDMRQRRPADWAAAMAEVRGAPRIGVNDAYPPEFPLATVPPRLLARLPRLPDELEYRFLGSRLILRDVDANLVVDYIDAALPRP